MESLPFFYAAEKGLFRQQGIQVKVTRQGSQFDCDSAVLGNSAQACITDLPRLGYWRNRKSALSAVMGTCGTWCLIAHASGRIHKAEQLEKKLLAVARFSASDFYSTVALNKTKLTYDDCFRPQVNDYQVRWHMLLQRQTDAAMLPDPYATHALMAGHTLLYSTQKDSTALMGCLVFRNDFLHTTKGKQTARALLKAYDTAVNELNRKGIEACRDLLKKEYGIEDATIDRLRLPHYPKAGPVPPASIQAARQYLKDRGLASAANLLPSSVNDSLFIRP